MKKLSLDKMKNKTAATAAATIAAAGVLIGGSFDSPTEILKEHDAAPAPPSIVETMNAELESDGGDPGSDAATDEGEEKKRGGLRSGTRALILRLPLAVRACVAVPLWGVGWLILSVLSALWAGVLSPVGSAIAKWLVLALMILAALTITVKTVFPKTPLKTILNKHTLLWVLGGSTLFCIADLVLQRFYPDFPRLYELARAVASAALLVSALIPALKREKKARDKRRRQEEETRAQAEVAAREAARETPEQARARVEREVLALADTVSHRP